MSIIYDSLKKVGEKIGANSPSANKDAAQPEPKPKSPAVVYAVVALAIVVGIVVAGFLFTALIRKPTPPAKATRITTPPSGVGAAVKARFPLPAADARVEEATPEAEDEASSDFPVLVLNGIFSSAEGGYALINGEIVTVGAIIDGVKVNGISAEGVEVELNGRSKILTTRVPGSK